MKPRNIFDPRPDALKRFLVKSLRNFLSYIVAAIAIVNTPVLAQEPSRQDFVAQGRQLVAGFRIRQVSEFSDYLKATTDVFQQIHFPSSAADGPKAQNGSKE